MTFRNRVTKIKPPPLTELQAKVVARMRLDVDATYQDVANACGCASSTVARIANRYGLLLSRRPSAIGKYAGHDRYARNLPPESSRWLKAEARRLNCSILEIINALITDARLEDEDE